MTIEKALEKMEQHIENIETTIKKTRKKIVKKTEKEIEISKNKLMNDTIQMMDSKKDINSL